MNEHGRENAVTEQTSGQQGAGQHETAWTSDRVLGLSSWHDDWRGMRVAVLGLGVTGFSVADTLVELGARVRVIYGAPDPDREQLLDVIGAERLCAESNPEQLGDLAAFGPDLIVVSPGYSPRHPLTEWARSQGIPVWGDIELGWRLRDKTARVADWICVTGTNGKTTTTQLTAHMLLAGGLRVTPAGNIGTPILDALRDPQGYDVIVVELSSYQLERLATASSEVDSDAAGLPAGVVSPYASVCLNFADDHLDWHGGAEAYRAAKAKVYEHTQVACVYNRADDATERMVEEADVVEGARAISFGLDSPPASGFGVVEGILVDRGFHAERQSEAFELVTVAELTERGLSAPHMVQNVLAASALARARGVEPGEIARAILSFQPDAHRAQRLGEHAGVHWIDDSKATNAHAADASLRSLQNIVWIVGGLLKGVDISELVAEHAARLKGVVVIGSERAEVLAALEQHAPDVPRVEVVPPEGAKEVVAEGSAGTVMTDAVRAARSLASAEDTVLLAPAAASMDQFTDYPDRGRQFQAAVRELE